MSDKESNYIASESCEESSFHNGLFWRDGWRIVELGLLAKAVG